MFAENLKFYRENAGLSQKELAEKLCKVQSMVARLERGTRQPSTSTLCELSEIFSVTTDDLLKERAAM